MYFLPGVGDDEKRKEGEEDSSGVPGPPSLSARGLVCPFARLFALSRSSSNETSLDAKTFALDDASLQSTASVWTRVSDDSPRSSVRLTSINRYLPLVPLPSLPFSRPSGSSRFPFPSSMIPRLSLPRTSTSSSYLLLSRSFSPNRSFSSSPPSLSRTMYSLKKKDRSLSIHTIRFVPTFPSFRSFLPNRVSSPKLTFAPFPSLFVLKKSPAVLKVEYAVRGAVPQKATAYDSQLKSGEGSHLPFKKIVNANIGNPQQKGLDQKPITWWRQVSSEFDKSKRRTGVRELDGRESRRGKYVVGDKGGKEEEREGDELNLAGLEEKEGRGEGKKQPHLARFIQPTSTSHTTFSFFFSSSWKS